MKSQPTAQQNPQDCAEFRWRVSFMYEVLAIVRISPIDILRWGWPALGQTTPRSRILAMASPE